MINFIKRNTMNGPYAKSFIINFFFFFYHTTCESTCDTLTSSAANQDDNTTTETVLSPWLAADKVRVSHVLSHVV